LTESAKLNYELRDDGVRYDLDGGIRVRVQGKTPRSVSVTIQKGNTFVPPETGNLKTSAFRAALVKKAAERLGDIAGLEGELELISVAFESHLKERKEAADEYDHAENDPALAGTAYRIVKGGFVRLKNTNAGEIPQKLTNFTAKVEEQVIRDDGAEVKRYYRITGQAGDKSLPPADVPAASFPGMNWVADRWGLAARIAAGPSVKDCTREAIELLSQDACTRHVFGHTGWRVLPDDRRVYLHGGGAVGADGVEVELEGELGRYVLPAEANKEQVLRGLHWSFKLLGIAPWRITIPLQAAVYLAPHSEAVVPDFVPWVWGSTGSLKSTLVALWLCHFGDFTETTLPLSFESTANALERNLFLLKDVATVVDDWRPAISRADASEMDKKAQRLLRSVGNRQGRGRMNPDTTLRHTYPPRGLVIATAEALPEGPAFESAGARALAVNLRREDVNLEALSEIQRHRGELAAAMRGYVDWLAEECENLTGELCQRRRAYREQFRELLPGSHPRTPDAAAALSVGVMSLRDFAVDVGFMGDVEGDEFAGRAIAAIAEAAQAHDEATSGGDPATRFIELLRSLFDADRAYVKDRETGQEPEDYENLGWDRRETADDEWIIEPKRGADFVGWVDKTFMYLDTNAAYAAVAGFAQRGGIPFGIKPRSLWRDLARSGLSVTSGNRATSQARIEGKVTRGVVQIAQTVVKGGDDAPL
jgi:hypothetical protein